MRITEGQRHLKIMKWLKIPVPLGLIGGQQVNQYMGERRPWEERKALTSFVLWVPAGNNAVLLSFLPGHEWERWEVRFLACSATEWEVRKATVVLFFISSDGGKELVREYSRFDLHISRRSGGQSGRTVKPFVCFWDEEGCENLKPSFTSFDHYCVGHRII